MSARRRLRAAVVAAALLGAGARGDPPGGPDLVPDFPYETLEPAVREQFDAARREVALEPADGGAIGRLGMLFHAYELFDSARACYRRAAALEPESLEWTYLRAMTEVELGSLDDAAAALDRVIEAAPAHSAALLRRADVDRERGRNPGAIAFYDRVILGGRNVAQAECGAGRALLALGDAEAAVARLERAIELAPEYGTAWYALARGLRSLGRASEAQRAFELAERHREQVPVMADTLARRVTDLATGAITALHAGIERLEAGDVAGAIARIEEATRIDPGLAEAWAQLGAAMLSASRLEEAETALRRAIALHEDYADALYNLGLLEYRDGRYEAAARDFARAAEIRDDRADAHLGLGMARARAGDAAGATLAFEDAIARDPADPRAHRWLATTLVDLGRHAEAASALARAVAACPGDDVLAQRRAWILATAPVDGVRDGPAAVGIARDLAARTRHPRVLDTLAAALAESGDLEGAVRVATEAVDAARSRGDGELVRLIEIRLAGYRAGRPWRDDAGE